MEETIGECTNLHITYPAMVIGYFAVLRANRTIQDVLEAPDLSEDSADFEESDVESETPAATATPKALETMKANDIAILEDGSTVDGIVRFDTISCRAARDDLSAGHS